MPIANGEHPKRIQALMGHSSINVTMDVYGHLMPQGGDE
ncbi:MAG: tyrosine-type recombinase/integrase, partial [bacterium]